MYDHIVQLSRHFANAMLNQRISKSVNDKHGHKVIYERYVKSESVHRGDDEHQIPVAIIPERKREGERMIQGERGKEIRRDGRERVEKGRERDSSTRDAEQEIEGGKRYYRREINTERKTDREKDREKERYRKRQKERDIEAERQAKRDGDIECT